MLVSKSNRPWVGCFIAPSPSVDDWHQWNFGGINRILIWMPEHDGINVLTHGAMCVFQRFPFLCAGIRFIENHRLTPKPLHSCVEGGRRACGRLTEKISPKITPSKILRACPFLVAMCVSGAPVKSSTTCESK